MGVGYELVNHTKRERVAFAHLAASKMRELAGNPAASAVTTWYMLNNLGDEISFVSDEEENWPFSGGSRADLASYPDVTDQVVHELLREDILRDNGLLHQDEDDPDGIYTRDLRNAWMPMDLP